MKTQAIAKKSNMMIWVLMLILTLFVSTEAKAFWWHHHRYAPVPVAICTTSGTDIALPYFVCCQKLHHGHHVWRDTWVANSCKNADPRAIHDMGCRMHSPVFGTGAPIAGDCQFSFSTGKFI